MTNLDLYAKAEHLLGIEEATEALYDLYRSELDDYNVQTLLDVGCGRGGFMQRMQSDGVRCKGVDLSRIMVDECLAQGLDVICGDVSEVEGKFDAIVSIFDVLNFLDKAELTKFLDAIASKMDENSLFIADINTLYGFSDVAEGSMSHDEERLRNIIDAAPFGAYSYDLGHHTNRAGIALYSGRRRDPWLCVCHDLDDDA